MEAGRNFSKHSICLRARFRSRGKTEQKVQKRQGTTLVVPQAPQKNVGL
jgi:hypothetical protein